MGTAQAPRLSLAGFSPPAHGSPQKLQDEAERGLVNEATQGLVQLKGADVQVEVVCLPQRAPMPEPAEMPAPASLKTKKKRVQTSSSSPATQILTDRRNLFQCSPSC